MLIFRSTCLMLVAIAAALGQPHSVPFQILGHIQSFKLDADCATNILCGATMRVNGIDITIPKNTIMFFPATLLTPSDVFRYKADIFGRTGVATPQAKPSDLIQPASGLALDDPDDFKPLAAFEADIVGNILTRGALSPVPPDGPVGTKPEYIAGLVHISQQSLNISDGYVLAINGTLGEMIVGPEGALPGDPAAMRIKINDPIPIQVLGAPIDPAAAANKGRYSVGGSPDARFTSDQENATIRSSTGFPMCIPGGVTGSCPDGNRPSCTANPAISIPPGSDGLALDPLCMEGVPGGPAVRRQRFTMGATDIMAGLSGPGVFPAPPCTVAQGCVPTKQAPFVLGDRITFSGTLAQDKLGKYISAHTVTAWVAIYSKSPVYVSIEVSLLGTGGIPFLGVSQETGPGRVVPGASGTTRVKLEAVTTDPSRVLNVSRIDYSPVGGTVVGNLVFPAGPAIPKIRRPLAGTATAGLTGAVTMTPIARPPFGRMRLVVDSLNFLPPPRELRISVVGSPVPADSKSANGVVAWQYSAPVGEFIFPENLVFGQRPVPANFENVCFLVTGSGLLGTMGRTGSLGQPIGPPIGRLSPWPSSGHALGQVTCPP